MIALVKTLSRAVFSSPAVGDAGTLGCAAPDPASDVLAIYFWQPFAGQITLTDVSGRVLQAQRIQANSAGVVRLGVQELPTGIYYLRLQQDGQAPETQRVLLMR